LLLFFFYYFFYYNKKVLEISFFICIVNKIESFGGEKLGINIYYILITVLN